MPSGTAIAVASATISIVPRIALLMPPGSPRKLPVGSVVKKSMLQAPSPFLMQVVEDEDERHERDAACSASSSRARSGRCAGGGR